MTRKNSKIPDQRMAERDALLATLGEKVACSQLRRGMVGLSAVHGFSAPVKTLGGSVIRRRRVGRG